MSGATPFGRAGGRADEWRVRIELPPIVAKLDRAAGPEPPRADRAIALAGRLRSGFRAAGLRVFALRYN